MAVQIKHVRFSYCLDRFMTSVWAHRLIAFFRLSDSCCWRCKWLVKDHDDDKADSDNGHDDDDGDDDQNDNDHNDDDNHACYWCSLRDLQTVTHCMHLW